jgi:hypothetical protein
MRHTVILGALTVIAAAACARGAPPAQPPQAQPLSVDERVFYTTAGIRDSVAFAVRDRAELDRAWQQIVERQERPTRMEDVPGLTGLDFQRSMLLVVAPGRLVRGDEVRVERIGRAPETVVGGRQQEVLNVFFTVALGCRTIPDPAFPTVIVRVPRYDGVVRFNGTRTPATNCE